MKMKSRFFVVVVALIVAIAFMRVVSRQEVVPLRASFDRFPWQLGGWKSREMLIEPEVVKVLAATDLLARWFQDGAGQIVGLYIGYYRTQREGATYHSPLNCLPGSGWFILNKELQTIEIPGNPARRIEVNKVLIQKGQEKQLVLYWYKDRDRVIASEYRAKAHLLHDAAFRNRSDGALVRTNAPINGTVEETLQKSVRFVQGVFPLLPEYLPN